MEKGVRIPNPATLDIGEEVLAGHISGENVVIYPGCRIYGNKTVISAGCRLGYEAPVTIDNCRLGPSVELKGGFFSNSVFLEKASIGSGAQVREGCLIEEEAGGAHCVGLKQTILFPFVTLGSLINFCDCLMAGGTSRRDHSEVGSSYIHFNYTPDGNKTTPSLFGDVPRGVMLNQPAIFLGGQGGVVGPARINYGTVIAAGSVVRNDVPENGKLVIARTPHGGVKNFVAHAYKNLSRMVGNNVIYLANLVALEHWYRHVRRHFFNRQEYGALIFAGAVEKLTLAKTERLNQLKAMVEKIPESNPARRNLRENIDRVGALFEADLRDNAIDPARDGFLAGFRESGGMEAQDYIRAVRSLPPAVAQGGTAWLQQIVDILCSRTASMLSSLDMFPPHRG